jgi:hypothetical protein
MPSSFHPETGFRYTVVTTPYQSFEDVFKSYSIAASRIPWLETLSQEAWNAKSSDLLRQSDRFMVFFGWAPDVPGDRKCKVAVHYSEMVGPPDRLLDIQKGNFQNFIAKTASYDLVLAHTPSEVKILESLAGKTPVALCPSGYEAEVLGKPDWKAPKERELVFYGYKAGRRDEVFKQLQPHLKHKLDYIYGWYGATRHTMMNRAKAIFNVPFSFDLAYPSFRVWQAISSSAPVILEPIDAWPSVAGKHYLEIPMITPDTAKEAAEKIDAYLDNTKLLVKTAKTAHKELSEFTIKYCLDKYLVPASAGVKRKKRVTQSVS